MNKYLIFVVILCVGALTGCSQMSPYVDKGKTAITTVAGIGDLRADLDDVEAVINAHRDRYTDAENQELDSAINLAKIVVAKLKSVEQLREAPSSSEVEYFHNLAIDAYKKFANVVDNHWAEYDAGEQILLKNYDKKAVETSKTIAKMLSDEGAVKAMDAVKLLVTLVKTGVTVASML